MKPTPLLALTVLAALTFPAGAAAPAKKTPVPAAEPATPIYDPDTVGAQVIASYQKVALDSGRRLLVNFGTNDCPACRVVNRAIHEEKFFDAFVKQFVQADVDVSTGTNAILLDSYHVNPRADLPAIVILMPDGRIIETLAHGEMAEIAKKGDDAVRQWFLARFATSEK